MTSYRTPFLVVFVSWLLLVACGSAESVESTARPAPPLDLTFETGFVKKAAVGRHGGVLVLLEDPRDLRVDFGFPSRELSWLDADGRVLRTTASSASRSLLDVALHPSGEASAMFASTRGFTLARFDRDGVPLGETELSDPEIDRDPPALAPDAPTGPIESYTLDVGRIAAHGEEVVAATRTARHSVVAYRLAFDGAAFVVRHRTLVVPAHPLLPVALTGGSYDTFGQLETQYLPHVAVDDAGTSYVAVQHPLAGGNAHVRAHERVFGERLEGDDLAADLYVTRIDAAGRRIGTSVVGTAEIDELYGLDATADAAYVSGRVDHWNASGTGFDAIVARVDGSSGAVELRELDVNASDVAFAALPLDDERLVVVGSSGYVQNPHGASVSEASDAFATVLTGNERWTPPLCNGSRHDEARFVLRADDRTLVVGGMLDGPGTHSADADPNLLRARGFLMPVELDAERHESD